MPTEEAVDSLAAPAAPTYPPYVTAIDCLKPYVRVNLNPYYIYADPTDGTGHLYVDNGSNFEVHIRKELERLLPTATRFLDIGANVGFHTLTAKCIRHDLPILAFEAHPTSADLVVRACVEQHHHSVTVVTTCLNDHCGYVLCDRRYSNATHAPVGSWPGMEGVSYTACTTLNTYDTTGVDVVKMDVDGFEYRILLGASRLLSTKPTLIFEYHLGVVERSGIHGPELLQLLRSHGYEFTALTPQRIPFKANVAALHEFVTRQPEHCTDILATYIP